MKGPPRGPSHIDQLLHVEGFYSTTMTGFASAVDTLVFVVS
jgi:hypothetical protein